MSTAEIIAELPKLTPEEWAQIQAKLDELAEASANAADAALGLWRDRSDLPEDAVEASKILRARMMSRDDG